MIIWRKLFQRNSDFETSGLAIGEKICNVKSLLQFTSIEKMFAKNTVDRYKTLEVRKKEKENVKYLDEDDVAGLPDLVVPVSQDVNSAGRQRTLELVNRLTEGRRERHQAALEDVDLDISNDGKVLLSTLAQLIPLLIIFPEFFVVF